MFSHVLINRDMAIEKGGSVYDCIALIISCGTTPGYKTARLTLKSQKNFFEL